MEREALKKIFIWVATIIITTTIFIYFFGRGNGLQKMAETSLIPISRTYERFGRKAQLSTYDWNEDFTDIYK